MHSDIWCALERSTSLELPQRQLLPPALLLSARTQHLLPATTFLLPAEKILHWSRKSPVCCVQPVQPPELQREGCTGRESAGFKKPSHRMMAPAPVCSAFPYQLCSCLYLGDFLIYSVLCTVIFQCRLIAIVTAPGRREDYLINVCEALLDPHMKAAKERNI